MDYKWRALTTVSIGTYMATMDSSIVNIALPALARIFDVSASTVLWVTLAFILTTTGLTLTLGRLGDMLGRKRMYTSGFAIFTIGLVTAGLAPNLPALVLSRVVQAVGAALLLANGNAIVTDAFPAHQRGRALGTTGGVVGFGLATGPALGGLLLSTLSWRSLFLTRIPVGFIGLVAAWRVLKDTPSEGGRRLDLMGAAILFIMLASLIVAVNRGKEWGWGSPGIIAGFVLAAAALPILLTIESRNDNPIVSLSLFKDRLFAAATVSLVFNFLAFAANTFLMPFYLLKVRDFTAGHAGLVLMTVPLTMLVLSPLTGWLSDRLGSRYLATGGLLMGAIGLFGLSRLGADTPVYGIVGRLLLVGVGSALFQSPNSSSIMGSVPLNRLGTASAMIATGRNVGQAVGMALAGAIFAARTGDSIDRLPPQAVLGGIQAAFAVAAAISLLGALTSSVRGKALPQPQPVPPSAPIDRSRSR